MAGLDRWIQDLLHEIVVITGANIEGRKADAAVKAVVSSQQDNSADVARANILAKFWEFVQFPGGVPVTQDEFNRFTAPFIDLNIENGNIVVAKVSFKLLNRSDRLGPRAFQSCLDSALTTRPSTLIAPECNKLHFRSVPMLQCET